MYVFPEEMKKAYEESPLSFVYYQKVGDGAVPVLVSGGFCKNTGMEGQDRERILEWLRTGLYLRMNPDDVGMVSKVSEDFLNKEGPYDVVFRCRIGDNCETIHAVGRWQTMPDGTELAVIDYINITDSGKSMQSMAEKYDLFQKDRFYNDPLTGLPNINYLHEFSKDRVDLIRSQGNRVAVVYIDIYSMQSYNTQYGFKAGDALLCLVADTLKAQFPKDLVMRSSDDHFIMVIGVKDEKELTGGLEDANNRIRYNAAGNTSGIRCGISYLDGTEEVPEGLDHARHALRSINNDMTRIYSFFSQEADNQYWRNRYIIENFDRALENHWIKIFYQGIVRPATEKVAAFEALARWVDPIRGMISPGEFIPVLQHYHQLYKLDLYMMEQVCREIPQRVAMGLPLLPVSVNISRQDFDHVDVVASMDAIYEKYRMADYLDKSYFIVEITEQDVTAASEVFDRQLLEIRRRGYRLWLDDFGSGYSAISMFSRYQFDLIKYDMELLRHLDDNNGANRAILKMLVFLAGRLKLHTLIEGVEDDEQLDFVRRIGCELVQGYYYFKPASLEQIQEMIREGGELKPSETREEWRSHVQTWPELNMDN